MIGCICLSILLPARAFGAANLLSNSSFEEGEAGWKLWHQNPGVSSGAVANAAAFLGQRCFRATNPGEGGANLHSDPVPCRPEATYTLSVYARVLHGKRVQIALWGLDDAGELVSYAIGDPGILPDECPVWGHFSKTVYTPANCTQLKAHLICNGGEVWWDAVKIEAAREATLYSDGPPIAPEFGPRNLLPNSGFEQGTVGWTLWHQFPDRSTGGVEPGGVAGSPAYHVVNPGPGGANLFSDSLPCQAGKTYTLSAMVRTQGGVGVRVCAWALDSPERTLSYSLDDAAPVPADLPDFQRLSTTFTTPEETAFVRAHLVCNGGEVWWDDVQIEPGDAVTEYVEGARVYDPDTPERRALARRYAECIVREARLQDAIRQARRLVTYVGDRDGQLKAAVDEPARLLSELQKELQAAHLVPDFSSLPYQRIEDLASGIEQRLVELWSRLALGNTLSFQPWRPALPEPCTRQALAREIIIFPCFTRSYHHQGGADWGILQPFAFRIVSGWTGARVTARGETQYGAFDHVLEVNDEHGYLTDAAVSPEAVAPWLYERGGQDEQVYLQTVNGDWSFQGNCHNTVNIWHPQVRGEGARYLTAFGRRYSEDERIAALELANEPSLTVEKHIEGYRYERVGVGGYSEAARRAWSHWLRARHGSIATLNERWRTSYESFDAAAPPADLTPPTPTASGSPVSCGAINDFQRFRAESHAEYFREMVAALHGAMPQVPIMSQLHHGNFGRKDAAIDLYLMATVPGWDYLGTHDWPGDSAAVNSLYAVSMNRYARLPHWEDEFIWSQWERKGTPEPVMRAATERNLWRQIAWGKRGISLFNLESEWLHDSPRSWNNSMLNIEADLIVPRYCTGVISAVERKANLLRDALIDTELAPQGVAILVPIASVYGAAPDGRPEREATVLASRVLEEHWLAFMVPEECIVEGVEDLTQYHVIIAPWAVHVTDELQGKLERWVRDGGTLVASGPFGLFDAWGNPTGTLMRSAFGDLDLRYDGQAQAWAGKPGRGDVAAGLWRTALGKGQALVTPAPLGEGKRPEVVMAALSEAIPVQPVSTDMGSVELLLRRKAGGTNYLFAINLSAREPQAGVVRVAGHLPEVRELSVEGRPRVPATGSDGTTVVPVALEPGECLCFELRSEG